MTSSLPVVESLYIFIIWMLFLCFSCLSSVAVSRPIEFASMNYIEATSWRESSKESNAQLGVESAVVISARNMGDELKGD